MKKVKLKEIKPGMIIHCKTKEEAEMLINHFNLSNHYVDCWDIYGDQTCYHTGIHHWVYGDIYHFRRDGLKIYEFEHFIINDEYKNEETAEDKPYITCTLVEGTVLEFDKRCEEIDECGSNHDMIVFFVKNKTFGLNLSVIPKSQIKMINFVHTAEEFAELLKEDLV